MTVLRNVMSVPGELIVVVRVLPLHGRRPSLHGRWAVKPIVSWRGRAEISGGWQGFAETVRAEPPVEASPESRVRATALAVRVEGIIRGQSEVGADAAVCENDGSALEVLEPVGRRDWGGEGVRRRGGGDGGGGRRSIPVSVRIFLVRS